MKYCATIKYLNPEKSESITFQRCPAESSTDLQIINTKVNQERQPHLGSLSKIQYMWIYYQNRFKMFAQGIITDLNHQQNESWSWNQEVQVYHFKTVVTDCLQVKDVLCCSELYKQMPYALHVIRGHLSAGLSGFSLQHATSRATWRTHSYHEWRAQFRNIQTGRTWEYRM